MRRELWGYAADEQLERAELIAERYEGIRPAPGYGCQPDHTEKRTIFALLDAAARGHRAHRELRDAPRLVGLRPLLRPPAVALLRRRPDRRDQLEDYAARKGWALSEAKRWLAPILDDGPVGSSATLSPVTP